MNKTPSILVDTGFEVDQNGALTEITFPNVVTTLDVPKTVNFRGSVINWIPSSADALENLIASNVTSINKLNLFRDFTKLEAVTISNVTSIVSNYYRLASSVQNIGTFNGCTSLASLNAPSLKSITDNVGGTANDGQYNGIFNGCAFESIYLPMLQTITTPTYYYAGTNNGTFNSCQSLITVNLPRIQQLGLASSQSGGTGCGTFGNCTALQNVTLGSDGHPVTTIENIAFTKCTQPGLTITIYTSGGASLSGEPWGATNATIVYEEA